MDKSTKSVINKIKNEFDSIDEFDELIKAWVELCEKFQQEATNDDLQFADVEKAAIAALSEARTETPSGHVGADISRMLNTFAYPAYLVTSTGFVAANNLSAWKEYDLELNESIDRLPFLIDGSEQISLLIKKELKNEDDRHDSNLILKRSHTKDSGQDTTIAITTSIGQIPTALVFIITTKWKPKSVELLRAQFALTKAEAAVLVNFVDGYSTQDIAKRRSRSHETVRAQFQSIREKLGAKNQTELLRTVLSASDFTRNIGELTHAVEHPYRCETKNVQKGGRVVEATLMGDLSGDPIVMLSAGSQYTFNAEFEKCLFDASLLIICICLPGCGNTDVALPKLAWLDQIGEDVLAVQHQLCIEKCPLLIKYTNAPMSYHIANQHPSRFSHIVQLSTCGPAVYDKPSGGRSPWVSGLLNAVKNNSAIKSILLKGAVKAWVALGSERFMRLQMSSNPIDAKYALRPENLIESEHALSIATQQGIDGLLREQELVLNDWTEDIRAAPMDITIMHGVDNKLFSIDSVRALANVFSEKSKLIEFENAGFTLVQSHPADVAEVLRSVVDTYV